MFECEEGRVQIIPPFSLNSFILFLHLSDPARWSGGARAGKNEVFKDLNFFRFLGFLGFGVLMCENRTQNCDPERH